VNPSIGEQIVFWLLAASVIGGALFTMTRRNPVTAVMSLVGTFFALAATYAELSAHFLAIIQILVYAGAIMVLFIFVVMILNREEVAPVALRGLGVRSLGVAAGLYLVFIFAVASIGDLLFRDFLYPFEAISLLLLVAVVGGVVVSRSHKKEVAAEQAAERRKIVEQLAQHDFPALADHAADAHAGSGGHH
jgi:NADH-quinone oxidoreductase subunit J